MKSRPLTLPQRRKLAKVCREREAAQKAYKATRSHSWWTRLRDLVALEIRMTPR